MKKITLFEHVSKNFGATYNPLTNEHAKNGYCVALSGNEFIVDVENFDVVSFNKIIQEYTMKYQEFFERGYYLGIWYNTKNNKIYLDTSFTTNDRKKALKVGYKNRQIAIFHLDTMDEIRIRESY